MKIGDYIEQKNTETIALIIGKLKNGSFKVLAYDWRHRVVQQTTSGWYPLPVIIDKKDISNKIIKKINRRIKEINNKR